MTQLLRSYDFSSAKRNVALLRESYRKISANLGVLCASAVTQYLSFNAEARSTLRFAEEISERGPPEGAEP